MSELSDQNVTHLLIQWSKGDSAALEALVPLVYDELRRLAQVYLSREKPGHTLSSTALVHEAYLRLVKQKDVTWQNRAHFFAVAARMMRRILVDHARRHGFAKRGGGAMTLSLDEAMAPAAERELNLVALDDALDTLAKLDERQSRMVELAVLRRVVDRRDVGGTGGVGADGEARVGFRAGLAVSRDQRVHRREVGA